MTMTTRELAAFFDNGWNSHDVDALMTFMADDCVFEGATGPEVCGTRYKGREPVRAAFAQIFAAIPDLRFDDVRHFVTAIAASRSGSSRAQQPKARRSRSTAAISSHSETARSRSRAPTSRRVLREPTVLHKVCRPFCRRLMP